jgi:hypothetical protein
MGSPFARCAAVSISAPIVADCLRWPGSEVEIHQDGAYRDIQFGRGQPSLSAERRAKHAGGQAAQKGRRSAGPPVCGWSGSSLVVHVEPEDDQPGFDARYRVSDDGARLVQVITLQGGRMTGFTHVPGMGSGIKKPGSWPGS